MMYARIQRLISLPVPSRIWEIISGKTSQEQCDEIFPFFYIFSCKFCYLYPGDKLCWRFSLKKSIPAS